MEMSIERQQAGDPHVEACLQALRALGPSVTATFHSSPAKIAQDGNLHFRLHQRSSPEVFATRIVRTHLSYPLASGFIEQARSFGGNWILFAPYVPPKIGHHLAAQNVSYVDAVGNCHIQLGQAGQLLAHVEGKKPARTTSERSSGRVPSYQVIFAILADPELLSKPTRQIAIAAGVGKTAVADQLNRLVEHGLIHRTRTGSTIIRRRELLDRWLSSYADILRPAWTVGRYRTQINDPELLEREIANALGDHVWALGGGAAAWRMTHHYRGPDTVLHVHNLPTDALKAIRAIPARDGALTILRIPGDVPYRGTQPNIAHPLLVYSEMISSADPRMNEAANELREKFITELT